MSRYTDNWGSRAQVALYLILWGFGVAIGVADLIKSPSLDNVALIAISFLLLNAALERKTVFDKLENHIADIHELITSGTLHLSNAEAVTKEMKQLVKDSKTYVYAIGSKSHDESYLRSISNKAGKGKISYTRLLTGDEITHQLHRHCLNVLKVNKVEIRHTPKEKYGNLLVSENTAIIALPGPKRNEFTGLKLVGAESANHYTLYFTEIFERSGQKIKSVEELASLCETCGKR